MKPPPKPTLVHFAKREWDGLRHAPALWVGMIATGAVLGVIGPFGTDVALRLFPRLLYWVGITLLTFTTGYCLVGAFTAQARAVGQPRAVGAGVGAALSAAVIYGEVLAVNKLVFGALPRQIDLTSLAVNVLLIVAIVSAAIYTISASRGTALEVQDDMRAEDARDDTGNPARQAPEGGAEPLPRLLTRLPLPLRGALVSLSVTDHYVHVTTDKGTDMLLLRLSDAIAETQPCAGFQIHRSHWVARGAIQDVRRRGRKYEVVLQNGASLPVSRTFLPQLKEAGFLRN